MFSPTTPILQLVEVELRDLSKSCAGSLSAGLAQQRKGGDEVQPGCKLGGGALAGAANSCRVLGKKIGVGVTLLHL